MLQTIKLLLPALMPSWRFFAVIAPSPRIELALLKTTQDNLENWQEVRPRPEHLSIGCMLKRMFFNARWNEALFLTSLAERLSSNPTEHSRQEILKRIRVELVRNSIDSFAPFNPVATPYLQFRLVFVHREGAQLQKQVTYISPVHSSFGDPDQ